MENLDIEKLERKNIYKVPDHFFEEMQMKVLKEIAPVKEAKIIKMNWLYSAAAAAALIFGITFVVNQKDDHSTLLSTTNQIANTQRNVINDSQLESKPKKENVVTDQTSEMHLTPAIATNQTERKMPTINVENTQSVKTAQKNIHSTENSEAQVDQIIASFTSADLADLSKNVEQDVYLDLYN